MNKLAALLLSLAALAAIPTAADAQTPTRVRINVEHTGKALTASGTQVVQRTFTGTTAQKWDMFSVGSMGGSKVAFRYRNVQTGLCLDLETPGSGRALALKPCNSTKFSQHWVRDFSRNVAFLETINRLSALAMSVKGASRLNGAPVVQESAFGQRHQKWSVFGV
jgi:opacity protein-like surface antigen